MSSDASAPPRFSCSECKLRKVKCDRTLPSCQRCIRNGDKCQYPASRRRVAQLPSRPKIGDLENRLAELEGKLNNQSGYELPQSPESLTGSSGASSLTWTGRMEQLPPREQLEELTDLYFTKIHPISPILHPLRYRTSLYRPPHMQPPMCLQYAIMTLAANVSSGYIAEPFYRRARKYLESDEMQDDGQNITVSHVQAWLLLSHFEAHQLWYSRASLSISRAVRISQMLGLHALDAPQGPPQQTMPPPRDWCELEERRRTFWATFMTDRGTSSTAGWPVLIDAHRIQTRLPSSEQAYDSGIPVELLPPPSFLEALNFGAMERSAFACRIIAMHLFYECVDSNHSNPLHPGFAGMNIEPFWTRFDSLSQSLNTTFSTLPRHLECPDNVHNVDAVVVNLQLQTATICLYRAAAAHTRQDGEERAALADVDNKVQMAAQQITMIIAITMDVHALFRNPFLAFSAFMAAFVFIKADVSTGTTQNMDKVMALMDVMVAIGKESPTTASLAVRLAHELMKSGLDPNAMEKVRDLIDRMDMKIPLLGKESEKTGTVVFCPMEDRFGQQGDIWLE